MDEQTFTARTDDLDGGAADRTVRFGIDGEHYTIDLSAENADRLREALEPYLKVATRVARINGNGHIATRAAPPAGPASATAIALGARKGRSPR